MRVLMDKSYLQGASTNAIHELCGNHEVILPEVAFYELMTTQPEERAACFRKIPPGYGTVHLTTNSGVLMRVECQNHRACDLISDSGLPRAFQFNPSLRDPKFLPGPSDLVTLDKWSEFMSNEVQSFKTLAAVVSELVPDLAGLKPGSSHEAVEPVLKELAADSTRVMDIYEKIRSRNYPPRKTISSCWVIYRTLQVQLLASVEYVRRYGAGACDVYAKRIENDVIDMEYCIMGSITGALASRDTGLINMFRLARPDGMVFQ